MATAAATARAVGATSGRRLGALTTTQFGFGAYRVGDTGGDTFDTLEETKGERQSRDGLSPKEVEELAAAQAEHATHEGALRGALVTGTTNLIDTSTHYMDGGSERMIGRVLSDLQRTAELHREGVVVVTKIGHVSPAATNLPAGAVAHSALPQQGQHQHMHRHHHCIHPRFIEEELRASTRRLGTVPDVVRVFADLGFAKQRNAGEERGG